MKLKKHILLSFIIYLLLFLILLPKFQYVINVDAISYFNIAKKYFEGHFTEAVNGYFGPLYSWLIVPSYSFGISTLGFARIINIIFSFMLIMLAVNYLETLDVEHRVKVIAVYYFIIPALLFSYWYITPDYLLLILTMSLILIAISKDYLKNLRVATLSSIVGSLMYLTKSFGLIFFLLFQTIVLLLFIKRDYQNRKIIVKYFLYSLILVFVFILPWIYLLSVKYGEFTLSTSGKINLLIVNPKLNFHHPSIESGITPPSDNYSVSAWDDPNLNAYPDWSPFDSISDLRYFSVNFFKNIIKFLALLILFCPIIIFAIFIHDKTKLFDSRFIIILIALFLNGILYSFVYIESRYVWISLILTSILSFYLIDKYLSGLILTRLKFIVLTLILILSPMIFIYFASNKSLFDQRAYEYAKKISNSYNIQGNIATTNHWWFGLSMSYFLDSKFFGEEKNASLDEKFINKCKNAGINYVFHYSPSKELPFGVKFIANIDSLYIYKLIYE